MLVSRIWIVRSTDIAGKENGEHVVKQGWFLFGVLPLVIYPVRWSFNPTSGPTV